LKLEHGKGTCRNDLSGLADIIALALHDKIKVRPDIEFALPGALLKSNRKTPVLKKRMSINMVE